MSRGSVFGRRFLFAVMILAVAVATPISFTGCRTVDPVTGERVYNLYSIEQEVALGRQAMSANVEELQKAGVPLNNDPDRVKQIQEMVSRISAVSHMPDLPYETVLVHTNIVNAAALPGGKMLVFEGLYDPEIGMVRDEDELAAVIAHEIAHINARHVTRQLSRYLTAATLAEVGALVLTQRDQERWAQALRAAFVVGTALWIPKYSRDNEREADEIGLMYMARAGYDPRAAARIWQRVYQQEDRADGTNIFSTHPSSRQRYEHLMEIMPQALEEYSRATGKLSPG